MGREVRRVPLDFDWPLNKAWEGFINPLHISEQCGACGGTGYSPTAKHLSEMWYGNAPFKPEDRHSAPFTHEDRPVRAFAERNVAHAPDFYGTGEQAIVREAKRLCGLWNGAWSHHLSADDVAALIANGRLHDLTQDFIAGMGWQPKNPPVVPTPREVNEYSISGMGHDSINSWVCVKAECVRLGVSNTCDQCDGEGEIWHSEEAKDAYENWESTPPPAGDGWQIFETVSEGSPISPPFSSPEDLARHMATTAWGADKGTPYATWLAFIRGSGWAPSMIMDAAGLRSGVEAVADMETV